mmetsp:Transcript_23286/g.38932  ORF Transcript_23286/g.38932 Transcript_23286/m.38932 type:complete len:298 (-) Transcript_23286:1819-2712(-)
MVGHCHCLQADVHKLPGLHVPHLPVEVLHVHAVGGRENPLEAGGLVHHKHTVPQLEARSHAVRLPSARLCPVAVGHLHRAPAEVHKRERLFEHDTPQVHLGRAREGVYPRPHLFGQIGGVHLADTWQLPGLRDHTTASCQAGESPVYVVENGLRRHAEHRLHLHVHVLDPFESRLHPAHGDDASAAGPAGGTGPDPPLVVGGGRGAGVVCEGHVADLQVAVFEPGWQQPAARLPGGMLRVAHKDCVGDHVVAPRQRHRVSLQPHKVIVSKLEPVQRDLVSLHHLRPHPIVAKESHGF